MKSDLNSRRLSTRDLAAVFGITPAGVRRLTRERVLKPVLAGANGRGGSAFYALGPSTRAYLKFINRPRGDSGKGDLIEQQTRKLRTENDAREREIVDAGAVNALVDAMLAAVAGELEGFADRLPADRELRARLAREVGASGSRIRQTMRAALRDVFADDGAEDDEGDAEAA